MFEAVVTAMAAQQAEEEATLFGRHGADHEEGAAGGWGDT